MKIGKIEINDKVAEIFIDENDIKIKEKVQKLIKDVNMPNVTITWDNIEIDINNLDELYDYLKNRKIYF